MRGGPARKYGAKQAASAYQAGLEAVFALAIAAGIGAWIDARQETGPVFLIVGTGIGLASCVLRLVRYQRRQQAAEEAGESSEKP
jgi:F0F1-type ATP synthase assembly protein I